MKEGHRVFLSGAPESYGDLLGGLPLGARVVAKVDAKTDLVHLFETRRAGLQKSLRSTLAKMKPDGVIWVS